MSVTWHDCLDVALMHTQYDQKSKDIYFKEDFFFWFVGSEIEYLNLFKWMTSLPDEKNVVEIQ